MRALLPILFSAMCAHAAPTPVVLPDGSESPAGPAVGTNGEAVPDHEIAGYRFGWLPDIVNVSSPIAVTVNAVDFTGNTVSGATGEVQLLVVLPDNTTIPLTPSTATLRDGVWSGYVSLPPVSHAGLRLRAVDGQGRSRDSRGFDILRVLDPPAEVARPISAECVPRSLRAKSGAIAATAGTADRNATACRGGLEEPFAAGQWDPSLSGALHCSTTACRSVAISRASRRR